MANVWLFLAGAIFVNLSVTLISLHVSRKEHAWSIMVGSMLLPVGLLLVIKGVIA